MQKDDVVSLPTSDICPALVSAINALTYVTRPDIWPKFIEWANDHVPEGALLIEDSESARKLINTDHIVHLYGEHQ